MLLLTCSKIRQVCNLHNAICMIDFSILAFVSEYFDSKKKAETDYALN